MVTFTAVLISLMAFGVATHFVPVLRRGRVGYPINVPARRTPSRHRAAIQASHRGALQLKDLPRARQSLELTLTPRREHEFVACDQVGDRI